MTTPAAISPTLRRMKTFLLAWLLPALFLAAGGLVSSRAAAAEDSRPPSSKSMPDLLRDGLFAEEANRDYASAEAAYAEIVKQFDTSADIAATALFRLAEVREKQGKKDEAIALHQRLLRDFSANEKLAPLSRERLAKLGVVAPATATATTATALAPEAETELRKQLVALQVEAATMRGTYKPQHPKLAAVLRKIAAIEDALHPERNEPATSEEANELARVRELVKNSPDLLEAGPVTPLTNAASKGWMAVARFLLDQNAKPSTDALAAAADNGHKAIVELLVDRGSDVNAEDGRPLVAAARNGRTEIAKLLLERGGEVNAGKSAALLWAVSKRHIAIVKLLIENGANINLAVAGTTPLLLSIDTRNPEILALLLDAGADPNFESEQTPLFRAVLAGNADAVKLLLAKGAKVEARSRCQFENLPSNQFSPSRDGWTALHLAALWSHSLVPLLLATGADANALTTGGETPLIASLLPDVQGPVTIPLPETFDGNKQVVSLSSQRDAAEVRVLIQTWEALVAHGAEVNRAQKGGLAALHFAMASPSLPLEAAAWLIEHGADVQQRDNYGGSALMFGQDITRRLEIEKRFVFPRESEGAVLVARMRDRQSDQKLVRVAEFDQPPTLAEALSGRAQPRERFEILRGKEGEAFASVDSARVDELAAGTAPWPELRWGDVVVIGSGEGPNLPRPIPPRPVVTQPRASTDFEIALAKLGEASRSLHLRSPGFLWSGERAWDNLRWTPADPLPVATLSEVVARVVAADPQADLGAVKLQRTVEGTAKEWTIDLRATGEVKRERGWSGQETEVRELRARLAAGDRLVIPRSAPNEAATAAQKAGIYQSVPESGVSQRVFTAQEKDRGPRTLAEFVLQSYRSSLVVPNPDFSKIRIRRVRGAGEEVVAVDLTNSIKAAMGKELGSGFQGKAEEKETRQWDIPLEWGDIVEIPQVAGSFPKNWEGLDGSAVLFFQRTLTRSVEVTINNPVSVTLVPNFPAFQRDGNDGRLKLSRTLEPELTVSALARRIDGLKLDEPMRFVIERDGEEIVFDQAGELKRVDPWLRDGDKVKIQKL